MTFLGVYQASCGQMLMKIRGTQAGAFPGLPIQARDPDFSRKAQFIALDCFFAENALFNPRIVLFSLSLYQGVLLFLVLALVLALALVLVLTVARVPALVLVLVKGVHIAFYSLYVAVYSVYIA